MNARNKEEEKKLLTLLQIKQGEMSVNINEDRIIEFDCIHMIKSKKVFEEDNVDWDSVCIFTDLFNFCLGND